MEALTAEETRKTLALKNFEPANHSGPVIHGSLVLPTDEKVITMRPVITVVDWNKWEPLRGYDGFNKELFGQYEPVSKMPLSTYVVPAQKDKPAVCGQFVSELAAAFYETLRGGNNPGFRITRNKADGKIYLSSPFGENPGLIVKQLEQYESAQRTGVPMEAFASSWNDPYVDQFVNTMWEFLESAHRAYEI